MHPSTADTVPPADHRPGRSGRTACRGEPGVIMIITLLAMMLLVALILFVLNIGEQVNRRVSVQDSADATAIAAATWTARSLNTVAHNNINIARTIALINVLDAMPQAAWNVEDETKAFGESLEGQLARGIGGGPRDLEDVVTALLEQLRNELQQTLDEVEPVAEFFNVRDVRDITHHNRGGALWRQMYAMDEMNQTIMENLAVVVQRNAADAGQTTLPDISRVDAGLMVLPLEPKLPYERGEFNDFQRPVVHGQLPPGIDDARTRRGPWDAVFGWRDRQATRSGGEYVPGDVDGVSGGGGGPGASGTGGNEGRHVGGEVAVTGYRTYGPRGWLLRRVDDFNRDHLPHTRLAMWVREISEIKLNQLWPGVTEHFGHHHNTEWVSSFEEAKAIGEAYHNTRQLPRVLQTAYFMVEIKSKHPIGHARFMDEGTWAATGNSPRIEYFGPQNGPNHGTAHNSATGGFAGWYDMDRFNLERLNDYVWRHQWEYSVNWDFTIDIEPQLDAVTAEPTPQPVYRYDYYVFAGANTDWDKQPENPWAGFNPNASDAPAPMNLDHGVLDFNRDAQRWQFLSYLAVVRNADNPQAWPSRFRGGRPSPNLVAVAQAKVFNNHSFDAWTPMWHAKLEPVSQHTGNPGISDWLAVLENGDAPQGVSTEEIDTFFGYLESITTLAPVTLTH